MEIDFTEEQRGRYSRHFVLKEIGEAGQKKLMDARVLVIGAGGLGSPVLSYLAAAGVGTLGIADGDVVDVSNLQRQIIHGTSDVGKRKVESAAQAIQELNPEVRVCCYPYFLTEENIGEVIRDYDIIIDAADTFHSKFLINDACVREKKPFVHGGIVRMEGQVMTYVPGRGPCFRCVAGEEPEVPAETGKTAGVLGAAVGVVGSLQAVEAIKYIIGVGELLTGRMLFFNGLTMEFVTMEVPEISADCKVCNQG